MAEQMFKKTKGRQNDLVSSKTSNFTGKVIRCVTESGQDPKTE